MEKGRAELASEVVPGLALERARPCATYRNPLECALGPLTLRGHSGLEAEEKAAARPRGRCLSRPTGWGWRTGRQSPRGQVPRAVDTPGHKSTRAKDTCSGPRPASGTGHLPSGGHRPSGGHHLRHRRTGSPVHSCGQPLKLTRPFQASLAGQDPEQPRRWHMVWGWLSPARPEGTEGPVRWASHAR